MASSLIDTDKINKLRGEITTILGLNNVNIPYDIKVSTMTFQAKLKTQFYTVNIYKYMKKREGGIVKIAKENRNKKNKNNISKNKNINKNKNYKVSHKYKNDNKTKNKNKQSDVFLNQVTVYINVRNKEKPVSVKIFNSGTIHLTGCVSIDNLLEAVHKLC